MYSRTLFGYRDAIDLWPENQAASTGLLKARLAFGEAAFKKGDFDLVLQTVDQSVAEEAALYARAIEAKKKVEGREKSLKVLKKAIAAVVTVAVVGLSGTTIFAFVQWASATQSERRALSLADSEREAKGVAEKAKIAAEKAKEDADKAREVAVIEKVNADKQREAAVIARNDAVHAKESESLAKDLAVKAAEAARVAEDLATKAAEKEKIAAAIARQRAAQIQLGEYTSSLALAKSQFESFDIAQGQESLLKLNKLPMDVFNAAAQPDFNTWGWRRIQLLSNGDLPKEKIDGTVTAVGASAKSAITVVGNSNGQLQVLDAKSGLRKLQAYVERVQGSTRWLFRQMVMNAFMPMFAAMNMV